MHYDQSQQPEWYLLPLTGATLTELQQKAVALTRYVQQHPDVPLHQVAVALCREANNDAFRQAIVVNSSAQIPAELAQNEPKQMMFGTAGQQQAPPIVFMFPGVGDHYLQMGRGLYANVPYFREIIEQCDAGLRPFLQQSLVELLYPAGSPEQAPPPGLDLAALLGRNATPTATLPAEARLQETIIAQPLVFSLEYALARLLQYWGAEPYGLIGYSLGEYVAATIAGVLTLEDALMLVAHRAQMIQALPAGKMLAVSLSPTAVAPYLNENVSISAHNGEELTVLAGEAEAILAVQQQLQEQQIACRLLDTTHAFHSHMMEPAVPELNELARSIHYSAPQIPYLSNVTGTWITATEATDPTYWARHMCRPVQYFTMLHNLLGRGQTYQLVEVGPGQSLSAFAKQHPQCQQAQYPFIFPTLRYSYDQQDDHWFLLSTIRKLWLSGAELQWQVVLVTGAASALEEAEAPMLFTTPQPNGEQAAQQKDRGEKRRQNRLRRRDHRR